MTAKKSVTKTEGGLPLPQVASVKEAGMHLQPWLIAPVVGASIICNLSVTFAALFQLWTVGDASAYGLAALCFAGNAILLGVFFGKNGKTGALSITE